MKFFNFFSTIKTEWIYEKQWIFYVKYFLPFILIIFSWGLVGNLIESNYKKENLIKITGKIKNIKEVLNLKRKNSEDLELRIYLENYPEYFRILDNFKYNNIQKKVKLRDGVQLYFRPKYLVPIGMGKQSDIYQLEHKNKILLNLKDRKKNSKSLININLIFLLVFGILYYFAKRKIKKTTVNSGLQKWREFCTIDKFLLKVFPPSIGNN